MKRIDQFDTLRHLKRLAQSSERLRQLVQSLLPISLQQQILGVALRPPTVIILTGSAAVASRLRFQEATLLDAFRAHLPDTALETIRVRVTPPPVAPPVRRQPPPGISTETRERTLVLAQSIPHPELRTRLTRLLNRLPTTPVRT